MSSVKELDLSGLRECYGLTLFIETGCFHGDGIAAALAAGFTSACSCDIDPAMIELCQRRFEGNPNVELFQGDSISALRHCYPQAEQPAFFWLDAHYPGHYGNHHMETDETKFPLREEIEAIAELKPNWHLDVIAFDDLRVINAPDNPRWRPGEVSDYYEIRLGSVAQLFEPFLASHAFVCEMGAEGIGLLFPRNHSPANASN